MDHIALSMILAFLGYSILNISQAVQKIGLQARRESPVRGWTIWSVATVAAGLSVLVVFAAVSLGNVSTVGVMAGTGLVSLAIFSRIVMNERLSRWGTVSVLVIVTGAGLVGWFQSGSEGTVSVPLLYGVVIGVALVGIVGWIASSPGPIQGIIVAALAGFLGAYSQLFQKLASESLPVTEGAAAVVGAVLTDPITAVWVGLSIASMVVLQFAYRHGQAIAIIPSFTAAFIATPVLGGVLIFRETLTVVQWIGVILIFAGGIVLNSVRT